MKLVYFTHSYPFGSALNWKTNELKVFRDYFEDILVVPFFAKEELSLVDPINGIKYEKPLFKESLLDSTPIEKIISILFSSLVYHFIKEALQNKVFLSFSKLRSWVLESYVISKLESSKRLQSIQKMYQNEDTIFYSYWGRDTILKFGFVKKEINHKYVCRFHGYDLYSERNDSNYLPYQRTLIQKLDLVLPCSDDGRNYLLNKFPLIKDCIFTARLGTISKGLTPSKDNDSPLRLVSCSSVIPLKRVYLIAQALFFADISIEWVHIGDGADFDKLREAVIQAELNKNVKISLLGQKSPDEVVQTYISEHFDLFINASEYEGVPVSIMEAMSAGIPVMAPRINGIPEIVDDGNGILIPSEDMIPLKIWEKIKLFSELDSKAKDQLSLNAFNRYLKEYNAATNAKILSKKLLGKI